MPDQDAIFQHVNMASWSDIDQKTFQIRYKINIYTIVFTTYKH